MVHTSYSRIALSFSLSLCLPLSCRLWQSTFGQSTLPLCNFHSWNTRPGIHVDRFNYRSIELFVFGGNKMSVSYVECECLKVKFLGAVSFFFFFVMDIALRTKVSSTQWSIHPRKIHSREFHFEIRPPYPCNFSRFAMYFWIDVEPTSFN